MFSDGSTHTRDEFPHNLPQEGRISFITSKETDTPTIYKATKTAALLVCVYYVLRADERITAEVHAGLHCLREIGPGSTDFKVTNTVTQ